MESAEKDEFTTNMNSTHAKSLSGFMCYPIHPKILVIYKYHDIFLRSICANIKESFDLCEEVQLNGSGITIKLG